MYAGGCLCGQVRWRADAEPINVRICHCRSCQKATGGAYFARALFEAHSINHSGVLTRWASSARLHRLSCSRCGTPVFVEAQDGPWIGVALATLDEPDALQPGSHIWISEKRQWAAIDEGLPQFSEGA